MLKFYNLIQSQSFNYRNYSSIAREHHLDSQGYINRNIIQARTQFLAQRDLLNHPIDYQNRKVYMNYHLFKPWDKDESGVTNHIRMQRGHPPVCKIDGRWEYLTIHHLDQTHDSAWVVLPDSLHRHYHWQLHSQIWLRNSVRRGEFRTQREKFWQYQAQQFGEQVIDLFKKNMQI